jgi:CheY-like chemotaxis protein
MTPRLLITDDEALILLSLADLFEDEDVDVTLAADGLEALAAARRLGDTLDVLVTDLDMPRMAGSDLIRTLRLDRPSLPVVVVSGSAPPGGVAELQRISGGYGPLLLVDKPFASWAVKAAVRRAMAGRDEGRVTTLRDPLASEVPAGGSFSTRAGPTMLKQATMCTAESK